MSSLACVVALSRAEKELPGLGGMGGSFIRLLNAFQPYFSLNFFRLFANEPPLPYYTDSDCVTQ